jgi:hypothetical protein
VAWTSSLGTSGWRQSQQIADSRGHQPARETSRGDDGTEIRTISAQPRRDIAERGWTMRHYHAPSKERVWACIGGLFLLKAFDNGTG